MRGLDLEIIEGGWREINILMEVIITDETERTVCPQERLRTLSSL